MIRQFYDGYGEHFKYADGRDYVVKRQDNSSCDKKQSVCKMEDTTPSKICSQDKISSLFSSFDTDDIILVGILLFLLYDGVDDIILILILGAVLVMGFYDKKENDIKFDKKC